MRRVIVDVDVGVDDFLAILLLLYAEIKRQIKIEAIICTMGNTDVENVCKNVVKLLEITRRTDVSTRGGSGKSCSSCFFFFLVMGVWFLNEADSRGAEIASSQNVTSGIIKAIGLRVILHKYITS